MRRRTRFLNIAIVLVAGSLWFFTSREVEDTSIVDQRRAAAHSVSGKSDDASADSVHGPKSPTVMNAGPTPASSSLSSTEESAEEAALRAFQAESARSWTVRREGTGKPIKTLVRGLWATGNGSDYKTAAQAFVRDYAGPLFGVSPDHLVLGEVETTDRTKIRYQQVVYGVEVYGGTLVLFFENGGLSRVQNDLSDRDVSANPPQGFTIQDALMSLRSTEDINYELMESAEAKTILYPSSNGLIYAFQFAVRNPSDDKTYRILFNAETRRLIKKMPAQVR